MLASKSWRTSRCDLKFAADPSEMAVPIPKRRPKPGPMPTPRLAILALTAATLTLAAAASGAQPGGPPLSADERRCAGMGGATAEVQATACTNLLNSGRYVGD